MNKLKAKSALKGALREGGTMNKLKAKSALSKGLRWPENEQLTLYFKHSFTYCFDKIGLAS